MNVQPRALRNNAMLRLPQHRTNYSMNGAIDGLQRVFNRVSSVFDFNLTREMLRRRFSHIFSMYFIVLCILVSWTMYFNVIHLNIIGATLCLLM